MIISKIVLPVVIVSLPTVNDIEFLFNKRDYTTQFQSCQEENTRDTINYNYITIEEYIQSNINKYQNLRW